MLRGQGCCVNTVITVTPSRHYKRSICLHSNRASWCHYTLCKFVGVHHYTLSSKNCFVPMGAFYFVFLLIVLIRNLFFCLKSSGKEPTQKETCRGEKFTANHYCEQDLSYTIMVVLQAETLFIAPVIKI